MTENQESTPVIVVVDNHRVDDYGNMTVVGKDGSSHKINKKHSQYHGMIQDEQAYTFNYRVFIKDGKPISYVHSVEAVAGQITDLPTAPGEAPVPPQVPFPKKKADPQAIGMAWKEIGELYRIRANDGEPMLFKLLGEENAKQILRQYRQFLWFTLELEIDGAQLPFPSGPKE